VFCVEHRSYKLHECSNSDHNSRKVLVCEMCSMSMEIPLNSKGGKEEMALILEKHEKYGDCDPKKKKPNCGVRRCKEILRFSNTSICKSCQIKFCLKHRFQSDHDGKGKTCQLCLLLRVLVEVQCRFWFLWLQEWVKIMESRTMVLRL
ncbi:zinc finger AN1 domain-containing stress-associated protein 12-like protein, partial [Tanacetum coccineum]